LDGDLRRVGACGAADGGDVDPDDVRAALRERM
jgi:hypothetical protein